MILSERASSWPVPLWALRIAWITLPLTAGPAASAALRDWSDAPRITAEALLWVAWTLGALATLAPRPLSLTTMRIIAPAFFVVAVVAAVDGAPSAIASSGALVATSLALALASGHDIALVAANAIAYGDEERVLLRVPPALFLGPLPLARMAVAASVAAPPLLLADGKVVIGLVALALAVPVVLILGRALHSLSRRWGVLVPAGFVLVDPLTLTDPVLFLREHIVSMRAIDATRAPEGAADLRLGAAAGSVALTFDEEAEIMRATRGRHGGASEHVREITFAVARRAHVLEAAATRRIRVG